MWRDWDKDTFCPHTTRLIDALAQAATSWRTS
jgi:hypothetical protein